MLRQTGKFKAAGSAGRTYTINVFTDFINADSSEGPVEVEGMKSLKTSDGQPVNRIGKGRYALLSGVRLVSDDPSAP
jgi:hypothetical protein